MRGHPDERNLYVCLFVFFIYLWDRASLDIEVEYMTNKMRQIHNLYC
jgi:hypothetical protein